MVRLPKHAADMLLDSLIVAALTFFSAFPASAFLSAVLVERTPDARTVAILGLCMATFNAAQSFIIQLAIFRGVRPGAPQPPRP